MDLIDPFLTFLEQDPDFGPSDDRRAVEQLFLRQKLIEDFLSGREHPDTVLDCLEEHGIDAEAFVQEVEAGVARIVSGCDPYVENESGLFLRRE